MEGKIPPTETTIVTTSPRTIAISVMWARIAIAMSVKPKSAPEGLAKEHPAEIAA